MNKKYTKRFLHGTFCVFLVALSLFFLPHVAKATSHYSYANSEKLTPLINWRQYGPDAFNEAIKQNKPIFLLLTAPTWCYWCQVYESEDYLFNPKVYSYINEYFIPVYVDADKRQDLTRKYLEGGWPSTTILTPSGERLFGYSGVRPIDNVLTNLSQAVQYVNNNGGSSKISYDYKAQSPVIPIKSQLSDLIDNFTNQVLQNYDPIYGGFGTGQKFPEGRALDYSLENYDSTGNQQFLSLVQNTLKNQYTNINELETNYHLFDPVEGGFHRYGTTRQWTPPHYEKMLYDNARLLKAYVHLQRINPNDAITNEVVNKTDNYIKTYWYDAKNGGFYGNTDVNGENAYYGKNPRPSDKPRVEKAKYADWNSEAILTYLYLWQKTGKPEYKEMASKSLDFFSQNMIDDQGAYHFQIDYGSKGVQGSLLDNSYMLLAFTTGYETLGDQQYLATAKKLADYSLQNLYDWNSGGFFERNSQDINAYAPGENISLSKPAEENSIIAYALLKLYKATSDIRYLDAGIKTIGIKQSQIGGLDQGYYFVKSAQLIIDSNLLAEYNSKIGDIEKIETENLKNFWVNNLVQNPEKKKPGLLADDTELNKLNGSILLLLLVAFLAGLLSFFSPCTLPILPAYTAYIFKTSEKNIKGMTIAFSLGLALIFTLLGMSATFVGNLLKSHITIFSQVTGAVVVIFGVYILLGKGFTGLKIRSNKPTSYIGAFLFGTILGLSWTPCIGPILVAILLLASNSGSVATGGILLFIYAMGLTLPLLLFSGYLSKMDKNGRVWRIIKGKELKFNIGKKQLSIHTTSLISGVIFIIMGYLIFSGSLFTFNRYMFAFPFQKWIFDIEDNLLRLIKK